MRAWMPRAAAALVAIICWAALEIRLEETFADNGNLLGSAWILLRFFTILTNLAVVLVLAVVSAIGSLGGALFCDRRYGKVFVYQTGFAYEASSKWSPGRANTPASASMAWSYTRSASRGGLAVASARVRPSMPRSPTTVS